MTFKNIDINKTASEAKKADYHFDTILKNLESAIKPKYTCEIK